MKKLPSITIPCKPGTYGGIGRMGTWAIPYKYEQAVALKKIVDDKTGNHGSVSLLLTSLGGLVGDDQLYDTLIDIETEAYERAVLKLKIYIKSLMKEYDRSPENFSEDFEPPAATLLRSIETERVESAICKGLKDE